MPALGNRDVTEQLISALYRTGLDEAFGKQAQLGNGLLPARSNFYTAPNPTDGALAATGVCCAVPVAVEVGDTISKIRVFVGAAAEATGTHAFAALYSGIAVPALLGQSTDLTAATAVGPVNAPFDFTLAAPQAITAANAPNGFVYASIAITATTVPTVASVATIAALNYQWFPSGPLFWSLTHGSAVAGTAPATIASPAAKAVGPVVVLY